MIDPVYVKPNHTIQVKGNKRGPRPGHHNLESKPRKPDYRIGVGSRRSRVGYLYQRLESGTGQESEERWETWTAKRRGQWAEQASRLLTVAVAE